MIFRSTMYITILLTFIVSCAKEEMPYSITSTRVKEGPFVARALSSTELESNYPMVREPEIEQPILFKLSLNGHDNEAGFGQDHYLVVPEGITEFTAPKLSFGETSSSPMMIPPPLKAPTTVHFRVDFKNILKDFELHGFTITATGDTIYQTDFDGLYIAGGTAPLHWLWEDSVEMEQFKFADTDADSIYELSILFDPGAGIVKERKWQLSADISDLPRFRSPKAPLLEALTNLALEEAILNIREDGAFSAGKEWPGVWTRDVSFASQLSLAYLFPTAVKKSLLAKLSPDDRIIQDTGTGGSWPVSSDRHIWTLAAWEVFLATGDQEWLNRIRVPILRALQEDLLWNRDPVSGMLQGETSFEDWREQTYAAWMTPADIHRSHALSTNVIFKRAWEIGLAVSAENTALASSWAGLIQSLDRSLIDHFWNDSLHAPASYIIAAPGWLSASHRDLLGESLAILYSNSFRPVSEALVASYPRTEFGSPVISHQLPDMPPYHNKAIWPFVEAYGLLAAKKAGNLNVFSHTFNGLIRSAALFISNRENYQFETGRPDQTEINSDRQLWSVAAWLSAIYKGLFGIEINYDFSSSQFELTLNPCNPLDWDDLSLEHLQLHGSDISIHINGSGSSIRTMTVNGEYHDSKAPIRLKGQTLDISITLQQTPSRGSLRLTSFQQPDVPETYWLGDTLNWWAESAEVILALNGVTIDTLSQSQKVLPDSLQGFYSLRAIDSLGQLSLPSRPYYVGPAAVLGLKNSEPYFVDMSQQNNQLRMSFDAPAQGDYLIRFLYSNGSNSISTGNTCGLAALKINDWWLEQMVSFPTTGSWDTWMYTSWRQAQFKEGKNTLTLDIDALPFTNMNGKQNEFRLNAIELIPFIQ